MKLTKQQKEISDALGTFADEVYEDEVLMHPSQMREQYHYAKDRTKEKPKNDVPTKPIKEDSNETSEEAKGTRLNVFEQLALMELNEAIGSATGYNIFTYTTLESLPKAFRKKVQSRGRVLKHKYETMDKSKRDAWLTKKKQGMMKQNSKYK